MFNVDFTSHEEEDVEDVLLAGENATGWEILGVFEIVIAAGTRCDCKYWACFARLSRSQSGSLGVVPCMILMG